MNSGAFDEAAFDFLVSDEGGANVAEIGRAHV